MKPLHFLPGLFLIMALTVFPVSRASASDAWITEMGDTPLLKPPFRKTFYAGEMLRVKLLEGTALRLSLGAGSQGGLVAIIPLKGGNRAGAKTILQKEPVIFTETVEEADELALRVFTGVANLEGEVEPMTETAVSEGERAELPIAPQTESVARFVNVSDYRSVFVYSFLTAGEDVSKTSEYDRTITLDFRGSSKSKTWKSSADRVVVEVRKGKVLFKTGQPFAGTTQKTK